MMMIWGTIALSLAIILVGCDLFTNSVEWAGRKLHLSEGAVGSVLAAVGTCLPETMIALLAIVFGRAEGSGDAVGIGAILGAPLMLSTLAFFVTGAAVLIFGAMHRRPTKMRVNHRVVGRDLRFFFLVFGLSVLASFLPGRVWKVGTAVLLLGLYATYVRLTFRDKSGPETEEDISPLHFRRRSDDPALWLVAAQLASGLVALVLGAHLFVGGITALGQATRMPLLVLSLILTPVATELPEKFNSVLWVRKRKDTLAMGNISGAMVFQSSVPPAIGMLLTRWELDSQAVASVVVAIASSATAWGEMMLRKRLSPYSLLTGGVFYGIYLWWILRSA